MAYSRFERVCDLLRRADSMFKREMNEWGLGCVFYYMDNFKVEESMLRVAAKFWDHKKHVFRFNWSEMCPTVEEFGAIMGNKNMESVLFSAYHFDPIKILCNYLDYPLKDMNEVIDKDLSFDLELLIDLYWRDNCPSDTRFWSMRVMILAAFFFVSDLEKVDSMLCGVAVEGKDKNLAPMILAETLMGLDKVAKGETQDFTGSPLLLQMWLYEHLYLFGRCPRNKLDVCIPARIHQRHQHAFPRSPDELEEKLSNVRHMELGVVPHWGINCMTQSFLKEGCVVVIGLHRSTFYPAYRVLYQFGRDQSKPIFPLDYTDEEYGGKNPILLDEPWKKRQMMTATDNFKSRMMLPSYLEWLKSDVIPGYPHDAKAKEEARKRCNVEIRNLDECNSEGEWAPPSSDEEEEE
uniref:Aminotransferase-like plant mobile domain-containing protein n=1 Tax=Quercus lobata TaxID=97700 RepID=A0A7N2MMY2_QUELO